MLLRKTDIEDSVVTKWTKEPPMQSAGEGRFIAVDEACRGWTQRWHTQETRAWGAPIWAEVEWELIESEKGSR